MTAHGKGQSSNLSEILELRMMLAEYFLKMGGINDRILPTPNPLDQVRKCTAQAVLVGRQALVLQEEVNETGIVEQGLQAGIHEARVAQVSQAAYSLNGIRICENMNHVFQTTDHLKRTRQKHTFYIAWW